MCLNYKQAPMGADRILQKSAEKFSKSGLGINDNIVMLEKLCYVNNWCCWV